MAQTIGLGLVALSPLVAVAFGFAMSPTTIIFAPIAYHLALGRRQLRALDSKAPSHLVLDQLALVGFILIYCGWQIYLAWPDPPRSPAPYGSASDMGLSAAFRDDFRTVRRTVALLIAQTIGSSVLAPWPLVSGEAWVARWLPARETCSGIVPRFLVRS